MIVGCSRWTICQEEPGIQGMRIDDGSSRGAVQLAGAAGQRGRTYSSPE